MTPKGKAIHYTELSFDDCQIFRSILLKHIDAALAAVSKGKEEFLNNYVLSHPSPVSYVTKEIPTYFGANKDTFISHNIKVVSY